jgi:transcriptional regulator with XRE-family HTH domain
LVICVEMLERMGVLIAAKRAEMCIGQKELADRAGIHRTYISDIERGRRNVTIGTLNKIAEVLGMTVGELLTTAERAVAADAGAAGNPIAELEIPELQPEGDKRIS